MSKPDFYMGSHGWRFHCAGYTSNVYPSYEAARMAYAAWVIEKQLKEVFENV